MHTPWPIYDELTGPIPAAVTVTAAAVAFRGVGAAFWGLRAGFGLGALERLRR